MFGTVTCCKLNFMYRLAVLSMLLWVACTAPNRIISFTAKTKPVYSIDPLPQKILLLNANDIVAKKYRDSKEELFISLTDNLMNWISKRVLEKEGIPAEVIKGYTSITGNTDSILKVLLSKYNATHAIVLQSFDVYFDQTNVEVVKGSDGVKSRTASYDIVTDIGYSLYSTSTLLKMMTVNRKKFHSNRSVVSGLLAAGPSVVLHREDARDMSIENAQQYLNNFFSGEANRQRPVFTGKGFEAVSAAITKFEYDAALTESLRFINDPDKEKAAKACYNCAVFFEQKNQPDEAIKYLRQSLSLFNLQEARWMLASLAE